MSAAEALLVRVDALGRATAALRSGVLSPLVRHWRAGAQALVRAHADLGADPGRPTSESREKRGFFQEAQVLGDRLRRFAGGVDAVAAVAQLPLETVRAVTPAEAEAAAAVAEASPGPGSALAAGLRRAMRPVRSFGGGGGASAGAGISFTRAPSTDAFAEQAGQARELTRTFVAFGDAARGCLPRIRAVLSELQKRHAAAVATRVQDEGRTKRQVFVRAMATDSRLRAIDDALRVAAIVLRED